jgi:multimeric flavodoxin WrbA
MKRVLGIVGSLRKAGNCELFVKEVGRNIQTPHELQLLRLPEFRLDYCNGCYRCLTAERGCVLKDDLSLVLDAIEGADALILAVPTYFLSAHSCLKAFVDRGISFYSRAETLWGKPAVGIGIAGIEGKEGSTLLDVERFFTTLMAKNMSSRIIYGALPGEVLLNVGNCTIAGEVASALFSEFQQKKGLFCSFCGGETFRFYTGNKVRCMLCSESGTLVVDGLSPRIEMNEGDHQLLANETEALKHRDWLLGMVGRFKEQKEALAKVRSDYKDEVSWISPSKNLSKM